MEMNFSSTKKKKPEVILLRLFSWSFTLKSIKFNKHFYLRAAGSINKRCVCIIIICHMP